MPRRAARAAGALLAALALAGAPQAAHAQCNISAALQQIPGMSNTTFLINNIPSIAALFTAPTQPFTFFAANDFAYFKMSVILSSLVAPGAAAGPQWMIASPLAQATTADVIRYVMASGLYPAAAVPVGTTYLPSLFNSTVYGGAQYRNLTVNNNGTLITLPNPNDDRLPATVVMPNVINNPACNITVHMTDTILFPMPPLVALPKYNLPRCMVLGNLTNATVFNAALELVPSVRIVGPITVFVPTDAAFAKLAASLGFSSPLQLANLPGATQLLAGIFAAHVTLVPLGYSNTLQPFMPNVPTAAPNITVNITKSASGAVTVAGPFSTANVVQADQPVCNGVVVHMIDTVLLPFNATLLLLQPPPPTVNVTKSAAAAHPVSLLVAAVAALCAMLFAAAL